MISDLLKEQKEIWEKYKKEKDKSFKNRKINMREYYYKYAFIRFLDSDFPDHYIDQIGLFNDKEKIEEELEKYENILSKAEDEAPLQKYFTDKSYLIASIVASSRFGHHDLYVFPHKRLAEQYVPDFVICGTNSMGYGWFFVELQSPSTQIVLKSGNKKGDPAEQAREGLNQIKNWNRWIKKHYEYARKESGLNMKDIDPDFCFYRLIIGRSSDFKEGFINEWRKKEISSFKGNLDILSYDRIKGYYEKHFIG